MFNQRCDCLKMSKMRRLFSKRIDVQDVLDRNNFFPYCKPIAIHNEIHKTVMFYLEHFEAKNISRD